MGVANLNTNNIWAIV